LPQSPGLVAQSPPKPLTWEMEGNQMKMPFSSCEAHGLIKQAQRIEIAQSLAGERP
jgi:hypothetical protein